MTDRRENVCYACRAAVLWATFEGKPIPLERCRAGAGDLAFQESLIGAQLPGLASLVVRCGGSSWRRHECARTKAAPAGRAFSAAQLRKGGR